MSVRGFVLVDANILIYARDSESRFHERARSWVEEALNGAVRIGLPWESLTAFLRIATHPRRSGRQLPAEVALAQVNSWLSAPAAWLPLPTHRHAEILTTLVEKHEIRGNLFPDAHLAALAIGHGVGVVSADTDFARFRGLRWINPLD